MAKYKRLEDGTLKLTEADHPVQPKQPTSSLKKAVKKSKPLNEDS